MGKPRKTKIKELEECPYFMTMEEVVDYLGFGRPVVSNWFRNKTFPVITDGTLKVCKYSLMDWLNQKYGKYLYDEKSIDKSKIAEIIKQTIEIERSENNG